MREVRLCCPKCGLWLVGKDDDLTCIKCKGIYTRDSLFCPSCMLPMIKIGYKLVCPDPECPSHKIGLPCHNIDCKDFDGRKCIVEDVFFRDDGKIEYRLCLPKKCLIVEYRDKAEITNKELLDIFSYSKEYKISFVAKL